MQCWLKLTWMYPGSYGVLRQLCFFSCPAWSSRSSPYTTSTRCPRLSTKGWFPLLPLPRLQTRARERTRSICLMLTFPKYSGSPDTIELFTKISICLDVFFATAIAVYIKHVLYPRFSSWWCHCLFVWWCFFFIFFFNFSLTFVMVQWPQWNGAPIS